MLVYHLMINCSNSVNIDDHEHVQSFVNTLVDQVNMVSHGESVIEYLSYKEPDQGYRLFQLTTGGSIIGHFMELTGALYLDVFSYNKFDVNEVITIVTQYFDPLDCQINFLTRQTEQKK